MKRYKIIVHVPENAAIAFRNAIGEAGAGKLGNYSHCSFTYKGIGRFKPNDGANPHIGESGKLEEVPEESVEISLTEDLMPNVIKAIYQAHPYEEPALEVIELVDFEKWLED
jgi:hypothetical protein